MGEQGAKFRTLKKGEKILKSDEYFHSPTGQWRRVPRDVVGGRTNGAVRIRRITAGRVYDATVFEDESATAPRGNDGPRNG